MVTIFVLLATGYVLFAFILWRFRINERRERMAVRLYLVLRERNQ